MDGEQQAAAEGADGAAGTAEMIASARRAVRAAREPAPTTFRPLADLLEGIGTSEAAPHTKLRAKIANAPTGPAQWANPHESQPDAAASAE